MRMKLNQISTWDKDPRAKKKNLQVIPKFAPNNNLANKISLWRGDITKLEVDAIVNAANPSLLGTNILQSVDGAIHASAGHELLTECFNLNGCQVGDTKITGGHRLPAKYILHTVGPIGENPVLLKSCYQTCLNLTLVHRIKSLAFCCISTGNFGYPNENAANVALGTVRQFLEKESNQFDRIIFCCFLEKDEKVYEELLPQYFPLESKRKNSQEPKKEKEKEKGKGKGKEKETASTFEIEHDKKLYFLKTPSKTLPEFESDVKSKLKLQENTKLDLEFKKNENFFVLDDIDDLIEGMRIKVSISTKATTSNSNSVCSICLDQEAVNAILPCGHRCLCDACVNPTQIRICPICRSPVNQIVKIFDS